MSDTRYIVFYQQIHAGCDRPWWTLDEREKEQVRKLYDAQHPIVPTTNVPPEYRRKGEFPARMEPHVPPKTELWMKVPGGFVKVV